MNKNLIPLQSAYIRQSLDVKNNAWIVFSDENEELYELPAHLTPKEAMGAIHLGRKFELEALNIGIRRGIDKERERVNPIIKELVAESKFLTEQNERLSTQLERFIIGNEED